MTALVTGASGALGRELAVQFSQTDHVVLSGRDIDKLEETRQLCAAPRNTTIVCGDLLDSDTVERLCDIPRLKSLRYLVFSHGEYSGRKDLENIGNEEVQRCLRLMLESTIQICQKLLPILLTNGGAIIHINSVAGINASPMESIYSTAKHGLTGFFKALRLEVRERGVRVLDVHCGAFKSTLTQMRGDYEHLMEPKEIAGTLWLLAANPVKSMQLENITIGRTLFHP